MTTSEQLRNEANASEEIDPTDSSIAVMRAAADWYDKTMPVLEEIDEYLDQRADAEYLPGQAAPVGNEEMRLLTLVRSVLPKNRVAA